MVLSQVGDRWAPNIDLTIFFLKSMWVLVGGAGASATFSITTSALALVVILKVALVPAPPTKTHIDLGKIKSPSQYWGAIYLPLGSIAIRMENAAKRRKNVA